MRQELEQLALIDAFLDNELSTELEVEFNNKLRNDQFFAQKVEQQKLIRKAIKRNALKAEIKKAKGNKGNWRFIITLFLAVSIAAGSVFWINENSDRDIPKNEERFIEPLIDSVRLSEVNIPNDYQECSDHEVLTDLSVKSNKATHSTKDEVKRDTSEQLFDFNGLKTWIKPQTQKFTLFAEKGGIIEGKHGVVVSVPANGLINASGEVVKGAVDFELIEATDLDKMVMYNLFTKAGNRDLRSGGMIYLKATQNGDELSLNPSKQMIYRVPTDSIDPEMQLFEGMVSNGEIDWINPQKLKNYLITVDFDDLNFLPKAYEDSMKLNSKKVTSRAYAKPSADSLYYTLDRTLIFPNRGIDRQIYKRKSVKRIFNRATVDSAVNGVDAAIEANNNFREGERLNCGINSTYIQALINNKFKDSYIATKEFEERLSYLHRASNGEKMLSIYVDGINDDLWKADEKVSQKIDDNFKKQFAEYAALKLTNTKIAAEHKFNLQGYYKRQKKVNNAKQSQLASLFKKEQSDKLSTYKKNYLEDVYKNGKVYQRKPSKRLSAVTFRPVATNQQAYTFGWAKMGWVNIDAYLKTLGRAPKKVVINYKESPGLHNVFQYLNTINNFTPLQVNDGVAVALFPAKSNEMSRTFAMSMSKNGNMYYWDFIQYNPYKTASLKLSPQLTDLNEIRSTLRKNGLQQRAIDFLQKEERRLKAQALENERMRKIEAEYQEQIAEIVKKVKLLNMLKMAAYGQCSTASEAQIIEDTRK